MTTTAPTGRAPRTAAVRSGGAPTPDRSGRRPGRRGQKNPVAAVLGWVWLAIIIVPVYWIVITSLKPQAEYFVTNPLLPSTSSTLSAYRLVFEAGFPRFFLNSVILTLGTVVPAVVFAFMASFAIVRGRSRFLTFTSRYLLLGLAIPLQATIIPVYLLIIRMNLYNSLLGLILPSVAFAIPLAVLILSNFIRDVPNELFESMRLDGTSEWGTAWRLAFPLTKPAIMTVAIYTGLQAWNGFLLPLILTDDPDLRVLPLALFSFQTQYTINVPAILAAVVLSALPILVFYVVGRRQLVAGLTAGFSK